jgi:hypothetical protein
MKNFYEMPLKIDYLSVAAASTTTRNTGGYDYGR